jgi:preprotein translocase subunit SecG
VTLLASASGFSIALNIVIVLVSLLLMFVILIQRGKGGGLAGAFGGAGGSSAFGSKAGDTMMKFTLYLAAGWILLIMIHVKVAKGDGASGANSSTFPAVPS